MGENDYQTGNFRDRLRRRVCGLPRADARAVVMAVRVTQADIAAELNLAVVTVNYALNGRGAISLGTRNRVKKTAVV